MKILAVGMNDTFCITIFRLFALHKWAGCYAVVYPDPCEIKILIYNVKKINLKYVKTLQS